MEAMGQLIVNLHQNLQEIRASMGEKSCTREEQLLQATLDHAEAAVRAQARQFVAAHSVGSSNSAIHPLAPAPLCGPYGDMYSVAYMGACSPSLTHPQARSRSSSKGFRRPPDTLVRPPLVPGRIGNQRPLRALAQGSRIRAKTSEAARFLPRLDRLDPLMDAPALTDHDLEGGLYNLSNRGFIPSAVDLTPAMERGVPVILNRPAMLYDQASRRERREIATGSDMITMVKFDIREPVVRLTKGGGIHRSSSAHSGMESFALVSRFEDDGGGSGGKPPRSLPPLRQSTSAPLPELLALPPTYLAESADTNDEFGTFCTEISDTHFTPLGPERAATPLALPSVGTSAGETQQSQLERRAAAATRIAAWWRGKQQRSRFATLKRCDAAARKLQRAWASAVVRAATKEEILRRQEEGRKLNTKLLFDLGQDWFQNKQRRKVEVHICSLSIPEVRRARMESYHALQASQICRIFRVLDPKRDVILVAPKALHEDILEYYVKIMHWRGIKNPPGRFQIVVPENIGLMPVLSLAQALLCSPKALRRIRKLVSGRQAMMVPQVMSQSEVRLASLLAVPLVGASVRNMALLASKSNAKKLCQLARLPTGPWATDIYDEDEFYVALSTLLVRHPHTRTWVFKIDDERESRGHVYIDLKRMREVMDAVQAVLPKSSTSGDATDELAIYSVEVGDVRQVLQRHVPRKAVVCNRKAYPDFTAWLTEGLRVGLVIQAVPEGMRSQTSVHIHLDPDGAIQILGSTEAAMAAPFIRAASWYPHSFGSWDVLREVGLRMGRVLMAKGLVGHASVDVVFHHNHEYDPRAEEQEQTMREATPTVIGGGPPEDARNLMFNGLRSPSPIPSGTHGRRFIPGPHGLSPEPISLPESRLADYELASVLQREDDHSQTASATDTNAALQDDVSLLLGHNGRVGASPASRYACWVVDVDARLTDEAANLWPLSFVAQVKHDPSTGFFHLSPDASFSEGSSLMSDVDRIEKSQRWALVSHAAFVPGMDRMNYATVFQNAKMKGVSFDLYNNVGSVFTFLDVFHSLCSVLSVDRTPETCARRMAAAASALSDGPTVPGATASAAGFKRGAGSGPPASAESQDGLCMLDVQTAMRNILKQWGERRPAATSISASV